jgi:hypothetical protein
VLLKADKAAVLGRRILQALIDAEATPETAAKDG